MAQSPDHPELQFIQAAGYTRGRPDGPPLWIVIHDMEAHETPTTAENTAIYFANGAGGRSVSSHYCADNNSVVQCVLLKDVAWTVGNRPGNNRGINWELAGFASQTRAQWLDPFGVAMFNQIAPIVRSDAAKYGIPLERRSIVELRANQRGITSHNDLRLAFGVTDHTDPGPNFPWDYFLALLNGGDDDMTPDESAYLVGRVDAIYADLAVSRYGGSGNPNGGEPNLLRKRLVDMEARLNAKIDALALATGVDPAALKALMREAVQEETPAIAGAVVDEQHARLAE